MQKLELTWGEYFTVKNSLDTRRQWLREILRDYDTANKYFFGELRAVTKLLTKINRDERSTDD